ncbi:putative receptor-like protein kinase At3g47110 [Zingiber officinale]|uniref:putative receptor-like protein kinase At3g47110 n=1 Tax=Zingiber officinale TaxID=94328 RepID=UPI001C4B1F86|nr:putative receptor-like protein kinase At3g47110 [Zingiber officinale]
MLRMIKALFSFLFAAAAVKAGITPSPAGDMAALLTFKEELTSRGTALLSWNQSTSFCTWEGVSCGRRHPERVTEIELTSGGLVGPISPSLGNLSFLRSLNLSLNALHGGIPSSVAGLHRLRYLNLSYSFIGGEIPIALRNCSELRMINLHGNQFTGQHSITGVIPASLANASSLTMLSFLENLIEGTIPEGLGHFAQLWFIQLSGNYLSGSIPTSLYNLSSLLYISVAGNQLHGGLSADIGRKLSNLQVIYLGGNQFTGEIPASITNCSGLNRLDVSFNSFSGRLPRDMGRLSELTLFSIGENQFEAQNSDDWDFFTSLTNCSALQHVSIELNDNLRGSLPPAVANFSEQLQVLIVGGNALSGSIPAGIGNLIGLQKLVLHENYFTGSIPEGIGHLLQLQVLFLDDNNLSGQMPRSLGNLTQLYLLNASYNALHGPIPATLGRLQSLTTLWLSDNFLDGVIPKELFNLSFLLDTIDLRYNLLTGSLPLEVGNLRNMRNLLASGNRLQGQIPNTLGDCHVLEYLALDDNLFQGSIPSTLANIAGLTGLNLTKNNLSGEIPRTLSSISGLQELYLAHNNLSGAIPEFLQNLSSLFAVDLSFNHLEGAVPTKGVFQNISRFSIVGNDGLCGGIQELHLPSCPMHSSERKHSKSTPLLITVPTLCFFFLLLLSVLIYRRKKKQEESPTSSSPLDMHYPIISYFELSKSTAGFDASNLIGKGRYGSVYKATLDRDGKIVAVKVFDLQQFGCSRSFLTECETLSRICHRNLVKIITCCSSVDSNGNDFKAIVFDFMPNKSLNRWLHPQLERNGEHQQISYISLKQRLNIAIDVAEALYYLHSCCKPPVVHCDLKPSNILLDEDMVAHVSDFGLAKILPEAISKSLADSTSSIGLRGSIGYAPPGEIYS